MFDARFIRSVTAMTEPSPQPEEQPSALFLETTSADLTISCSALSQQPGLHGSSTLAVLLMLVGRVSLGSLAHWALAGGVAAPQHLLPYLAPSFFLGFMSDI